MRLSRGCALVPLALFFQVSVKRGALVSTQYNTINFVRTIEEVLGIQPMNLNDAIASPMADIFTTKPAAWSFTATPSAMLCSTQLPGSCPKSAASGAPKPRHDGKYWGKVTKGLDFTTEDRLDGESYNRILWKGVMGDKPYPEKPTGKDLRKNRKALLDRHRKALKQGI